mmetsp:Transcript_21902/g.28575  ORF Transcript_21902/g.28575 Transcript_21902/m.28575 type:complete len:97 (-) Transcript_21902:73-363(-)
MIYESNIENFKFNLLKWCESCIHNNNNFRFIFLPGTIVNPSSSPFLTKLNGMIELKQVIAEFVGIECGRPLRNIRELKDCLFLGSESESESDLDLE